MNTPEPAHEPAREPMGHDTDARPWLRPDLPLEQRVDALLAEMTLAEKVGQTHQIAQPRPSSRPRPHQREALLGTWTLDGRGEDVASPAAALRARLLGEAVIDDGRFSDRTLHLVREDDVTIALVGEHPSLDPGEAVVTVGPDASSGVSTRITVTG